MQICISLYMLHCSWTRLEDDHSHPALGSGQEGSSHIFAHNPFMTIFQFKKKEITNEYAKQQDGLQPPRVPGGHRDHHVLERDGRGHQRDAVPGARGRRRLRAGVGLQLLLPAAPGLRRRAEREARRVRARRHLDQRHRVRHHHHHRRRPLRYPHLLRWAPGVRACFLKKKKKSMNIHSI